MSTTATNTEQANHSLFSTTKLHHHQARSRELDVSILVVLYWIRRQNNIVLHCNLFGVSFNPCCIGLGAKTRLVYKRKGRAIEVSILVVLD